MSGPSPSLSGALRGACLESWLCLCCSIQSTRWPHYRGVDRDASVTQGVRTAFSCSGQPSGVHERERERTSFQRRYSRALCLCVFLDPVIHARDMLPPESIGIGGSHARVKDKKRYRDVQLG